MYIEDSGIFKPIVFLCQATNFESQLSFTDLDTDKSSGCKTAEATHSIYEQCEQQDLNGTVNLSYRFLFLEIEIEFTHDH
ncbi:hypothetical protein JTB14_032426 [Gonioctena quinquepunctata]|nr:hypothetical protein JTB14_032426 [Gonioctena quinquepunctata]